jgi:hypothetical protein
MSFTSRPRAAEEVRQSGVETLDADWSDAVAPPGDRPELIVEPAHGPDSLGVRNSCKRHDCTSE